ncbi:MAG: DUF2207 domain-containing protein, partial [Rhodobacteraceae bacterium]|nr:DUF2207 domain-containing protein [Paracoccaceae bacterium]
EEILSHDTVLAVLADGTLEVSETIRVRAEADAIRHGIYRDFPLRRRSPAGQTVQTGLTVLAVQRNGADAPHLLSEDGAVARLRIGAANRLLPVPSEQTYRIVYRATGHLDVGLDQDRLLWTAIGADWDFPVAAASVEIRVPEGVPILNPQAYTVGRFRRAGDGIETAAAPGEFRATVTRALPPGPRLALDIGWPANAIAFAPAPLAPDARRAWQMSPALAAAAASLAGIAALFLVWLAVGRDRTRGTIYPQFDPPRSLSPAALRFVQRQGFDETCLTAAILSMAVKGRSGSRSTKAARNGACRSIRCRPWAPKASSSARASRRSTRRSWLGSAASTCRPTRPPRFMSAMPRKSCGARWNTSIAARRFVPIAAG